MKAYQYLNRTRQAGKVFGSLVEGKRRPLAQRWSTDGLQASLIKSRNIAMGAEQVEDATDEGQQACARGHQALHTLQENDIPINQYSEKILAELDQMLSNNQSQ
mgnify:CR=1 FL=1